MKFDNSTMIKVIFLITNLIFGLNSQAQQLTRLWETEEKLQQPESVIYHKKNNVFYVSSLSGEYGAKDGNGFISKVSVEGKILDLKWVDSLDNPQGMAIFREKLYVADLKRVLVIDIDRSKIIQEFKVDSAKYFNDITLSKKGEIFVSDIFGNKIYRLKKGNLNLWSDNALLNMPNGLLVKGRNLMVLNFGNGILYQASLKTKIFVPFSSGIKNGDGITTDGQKGFLVSGAWQGEIYHISNTGEMKLVFKPGLSKIMTADLFYLKEKQMLLVPTLNKTLIAYSYK